MRWLVIGCLFLTPAAGNHGSSMYGYMSNSDWLTSYSNYWPTPSYSDDWPTSSYSDDWPTPSYSNDGSYSNDWPTPSYSDDWPTSSYSDDWPTPSYSDDWSYSNDWPSPSYSNGWPTPSYSNDWPTPSYSNDWPTPSYSNDWPTSSYSNDWPTPSYSDVSISISQSWTVSPSMDTSSSVAGSYSTVQSSDYSTAASLTSTSTINVGCTDDSDCPPSFFCNDNTTNGGNYGNSSNSQNNGVCDLETPLQPNFTVGVVAMSPAENLVALYCNFHTENNLKYQILWRADSDVIYESGLLTDSEAAAHFVNSQNLSVNGFALEKNFSCEVNVYIFDIISTSDTHMAGPYYSNEIIPVEINDTAVYMQRGGDAEIAININIPFPCARGDTCTLDFKFYDPDESHDCGNATIAFKNRYTCGERITGSSQTVNAQAVGEKRIIITTKNNAKYNLKSEFNLVMKVEISGTSTEFWWAGTFSQPLTVYVSDYAHYWKGNFCYANNDPRLRTLDGYYYSLQTEGEYVMMRHKELPVQVNLLTESCNYGFGTCSCGVIVRAGKDVYTVNHCSGEHMSAYSSIDGDVSFGNVGDTKKRVLYARERSSNRWQVYLPHGTVVDISVSSRAWFSWTMVNVEIIPSPSDMDKLEGLCGNFNGDYTDDLVHSGGTVTTATDYYCWRNCDEPDDFVASWEVDAADSLLDPNNQVDLSPWNYDDYLCVCTGNNGEGDATCSANEEASCTHIDRAGDVDDYNIRSRRSAESRERRERREAFTREIERSLFDRDINRRLMKTLEKRQAVEQRIKRSISQQTVSEADALAMCQSYMDSACGVIINNTQSRINITNNMRDCAQDTMLHNDTNWGACTCDGALKEAEVYATADETVDSAFITAVKDFCNNHCSSKGTCSNGKCVCNSNYALDDCSLDKTSKVTITDITGGGICNKGAATCKDILIVTDGVISGSKCSLKHYDIDINGTVTYMGEQQVDAVYVNAYEAYCPVPITSSRRRRSTSSGGSSVAASYSVSVSNDGSTYSDPSSVVVLDNTCLTYTNSSGTISIALNASYCLIDGTCYANGTNQTGTPCNYCDVSSDSFDWTLMSDYCLIGSTCYTNGTTKTGDRCNYCDVTLDATAWTFDNETESCFESDEDEGLKGYIIAIIVIFSLLGFAGLVALGYVIRQKYLASKTRKGGLFDTPLNKKFNIRVEPAPKESWDVNNSTPLPKIYADPKPGTEGVPDNLYSDRNLMSRSDTVVPAMPWGNKEGQTTPRPISQAPPAPWANLQPKKQSFHVSTIQIGNQEVEEPRSRASISSAPSSAPSSSVFDSQIINQEVRCSTSGSEFGNERLESEDSLLRLFR